MGHDTDMPDTGAVVPKPKSPRSRKRKVPEPKPESESLTTRPRRSRVARASITPPASGIDSLLAAVAGEEASMPSPNEATTAEEATADVSETRAKLKLETSTSREAIAATLESLGAQMRSGALSVEEGGVTISLAVAGRVELDVHASRKGKRGRLELRISWKS